MLVGGRARGRMGALSRSGKTTNASRHTCAHNGFASASFERSRNGSHIACSGRRQTPLSQTCVCAQGFFARARALFPPSASPKSQASGTHVAACFGRRIRMSLPMRRYIRAPNISDDGTAQVDEPAGEKSNIDRAEYISMISQMDLSAMFWVACWTTPTARRVVMTTSPLFGNTHTHTHTLCHVKPSWLTSKTVRMLEIGCSTLSVVLFAFSVSTFAWFQKWQPFHDSKKLRAKSKIS